MEKMIYFTPDHWHWLVLGVVLMVAEVVVPGVYLLWVGLAALLTGIVAYVLPNLGWEIHAVFFAIAMVGCAVLGYRLYAKGGAEENGLNRRGTEFIGQTYTLETAVVGGVGRLKVSDSPWRIVGPDLPAGAKIRIVAIKGTSLEFEEVKE